MMSKATTKRKGMMSRVFAHLRRQWKDEYIYCILF
jgi:hypothetical protein